MSLSNLNSNLDHELMDTDALPLHQQPLSLQDWYDAQAAAEALEMVCPRPLVDIDEAYIVPPTSARSKPAQAEPLFSYYDAQILRSTSQSKLRKQMIECKVDEMIVEPHNLVFNSLVCV